MVRYTDVEIAGKAVDRADPAQDSPGVMFTAILREGFRHNAPFTVGKTYEVLDFNEYLGTYTIIADNGERQCLDWLRFEDRGYAINQYRSK